MLNNLVIRRFLLLLSFVCLSWMYMVLLVSTANDQQLSTRAGGSGQRFNSSTHRLDTFRRKGDVVRRVFEQIQGGAQAGKMKLLDIDANGNFEANGKFDANSNFDANGNFDATSQIVDSNEQELLQRLPKAIIIGVKKCGTRALLEYLKIHPKIRATGPEPHFFDRYYHLGLDWYRQQMPLTFPDQITIEKTPRYFVTKEVPERIYNMSRDTKLLVVTRDPVVRAISDFTQAVSKHVYSDDVTFSMKAIRRNGDVNARWSAITTGLYGVYLARWLRYFDLENIHFVNGENLIKNPVEELNAVQDFLGLERRIDNSRIYFNHTRGFPCIRRADDTPKCFRRSKGRPHVQTDNQTLQKLYEFYAPHNAYFYELSKQKPRPAWNNIESSNGEKR